MRICSKCAKLYDEPAKICRGCGGILDELAPSEVVRDESVGETPGKVTFVDPPKRPDKWSCGCGESNPGTFEVCWKCGTEFGAEYVPGTVAESAEVEMLDEEEQQARDAPAARPCMRCGSTTIIEDAAMLDGRDHGRYDHLQAAVEKNPYALFFKGRVKAVVRADICGDCGHVELFVTNPAELLQAYREIQ